MKRHVVERVERTQFGFTVWISQQWLLDRLCREGSMAPTGQYSWQKELLRYLLNRRFAEFRL